MYTLQDARLVKIYKYLSMDDMTKEQLYVWDNLSIADRVTIRNSNTYNRDVIAY